MSVGSSVSGSAGLSGPRHPRLPPVLAGVGPVGFSVLSIGMSVDCPTTITHGTGLGLPRTVLVVALAALDLAFSSAHLAVSASLRTARRRTCRTRLNQVAAGTSGNNCSRDLGGDGLGLRMYDHSNTFSGIVGVLGTSACRRPCRSARRRRRRYPQERFIRATDSASFRGERQTMSIRDFITATRWALSTPLGCVPAPFTMASLPACWSVRLGPEA